jgi:hypothetical protein
MNFFEAMCSDVNNFSTLVYANTEDAWERPFITDGKPRQWQKRYSVQPNVNKRLKKQKTIADFAALAPGCVVLSQKAYDVVGSFLGQFGQLLELDCVGEVRYWYNVTNLVACVDFEKSEKSGDAVTKAEFLPGSIPADAQIFKDPLTASTRIYLTSAAKEMLEKLIADAGLTGLAFFTAGEGRYT